jgi:hypothetical protein
VTVINPDGQSATLASAFTYIVCTYEISPLRFRLPGGARGARQLPAEALLRLPRDRREVGRGLFLMT